MAEYNAAREGDEIAHTASAGWMIAGAIGGAILGAAAVVVTGGTALVAVAAVSAGACAAGGLGEVLGSMSWAPRHVTGKLISGSPNVFINSRPAIRAHLSFGECTEHSGSVQVVAEGSSRVYINNYPAARINDRLSCSAEIHTGSPNVFIGGTKVQTDDISPEIPEWINWTMLGIGIAAVSILAPPAVAVLSTLGGLGGSYVGGLAGGQLFGEGSDGQKWSILLGGMVGGAAGAKGGLRFDGWRGATSKNLTPDVSPRRTELNAKFGRTGNLDRDINIRGNTEIVINFMKKQGISENKIPEYMEGINLEKRVSIETVNGGKLTYQNQVPGNWQGNWYSMDKTIPPTRLGINPEGNLYGTETRASKIVTTYQSQR